LYKLLASSSGPNSATSVVGLAAAAAGGHACSGEGRNTAVIFFKGTRRRETGVVGTLSSQVLSALAIAVDDLELVLLAALEAEARGLIIRRPGMSTNRFELRLQEDIFPPHSSCKLLSSLTLDRTGTTHNSSTKPPSLPPPPPRDSPFFPIVT
jgi:hypothetical protein